MPAQIEKTKNNWLDYQLTAYSKTFSIGDFKEIQNKFSNLKNFNEKKIQKK